MIHFYKKNFNLSKMTWMGIGGNAEEFFVPENLNELLFFLKENQEKQTKPITIIGACSNVVISDNGISGLTIKLGDGFKQLERNGKYIYAGSAALVKNLSNFAYHNSLTNFEFLLGIPGTIGGSISMNAGCYNSTISDILVYIIIATNDGKLKIINKKDIGFFYRGSNLKKSFIICGALFEGIKEEKEKIYQKMQTMHKKRFLEQPIHSRTVGCTFKNPINNSAWKLIDASGCRGMRVGGAVISEKHCNFIINDNNATASDVKKLISLIQKKVKQSFNVDLELEIKMIGDFNIET